MTSQERAAWALGYKLYDEYAPALRQAALLKDDGDMACRLFESILAKLKAFYDASDRDSRLIALAVYDILGKVHAEARKSDSERV